MDPLVSEKSISYAEPAVYASRDFVTIHQTERPILSGKWYGPNETIQISLRNIAQNELLDASKCFLEFGVVVDLPLEINGSTGGTGPDKTAAPQFDTPVDACVNAFGVPAWGLPFFSSVTAAIPGLATEKYLDSDLNSQVFCSSRLLCSSGVGSWDPVSERFSFEIKGAAQDAGAKSVYSRATCVKGRYYTSASDPHQPKSQSYTAVGRSVLYYKVPLGLLSRTFNSCSSMVPISYYSSGSDCITFTLNTASSASALNDMSYDFPTSVGQANYYIIDPCVSFSKTMINSTAVLSVLEAMFRGVSSVQITDSLSVPVPLVQKQVDYSFTTTTVSNSTGLFQVNVTANQPSCRAVLLRFSADSGLTYEKGGLVTRKTHSAKYLLSPAVFLENLQMRIGSMRVPLDSVSDVYVPAGGYIPGSSSVKNGDRGIYDFVSQKIFSRLYNAGKSLFSPFAVSEELSLNAMSLFHESPVSSAISSSSFASVIRGNTLSNWPAPGGATGTDLYTLTSGQKSESVFAGCLSPNLFVFPFESFAHVFNMREDSFALRGLDLRNISNLTITGKIALNVSAADISGDSLVPGFGNDVKPNGAWTIRAILAYDALEVLLAGRIDRDAQFSLIPSGATSVPVN